MTNEKIPKSALKRTIGGALVVLALVSIPIAFFKKQSESGATVSAAAVPNEGGASAGVSANTGVTQKPHVLVRYLHGSARCVSCQTIEAYANEAIRSAFSKEIESGKLVWSSVDVENHVSRHLIQEFQLSSQSIVLTDEGTKTPKSWKKLDKVWELLRDKTAFIEYVQKEIRAYMGAG